LTILFRITNPLYIKKRQLHRTLYHKKRISNAVSGKKHFSTHKTGQLRVLLAGKALCLPRRSEAKTGAEPILWVMPACHGVAQRRRVRICTDMYGGSSTWHTVDHVLFEIPEYMAAGLPKPPFITVIFRTGFARSGTA
jgi:hypothetical protein